MWYTIYASDSPNSLKKRLSVRPKHLIRLKELQENGRLLIAGPFPAIDSEDPGENGFTGSLIIAEFNNLEDAKEWAHKDPFFIEGIYSQVDVKKKKKSLP